jgi:hypothetical protein
VDEHSTAGWTDPPKRAWRRETLGSSNVSVQSPQGPQPVRIIGSKHDDRDAISSESVEHGCTSFRVCGWQFVGGAHLACVKGRETRADASFARSSVAVDAAPGDRGVKGCDAGPPVSSNERSTRLRSANRKVRRGPHDDRRLGFVLTAYPSPGLREAGLGQRVQPPRTTGSQELLVWGAASARSMKPTQSCPRVTRAGFAHLARGDEIRRRDVRGR